MIVDAESAIFFLRPYLATWQEDSRNGLRQTGLTATRRVSRYDRSDGLQIPSMPK